MDKKSRLLVMGKLYFKNKDYKLAESSFIEYLNSSPEDFQALKLLAQTYEFQRDYAKAFDAYERCYLAEPDRKGVLLDICRLLLMNDASLDHIDANRWLKLAVQAFPSNPIVMNLKQSLPIVESTPSKTSIENEILNKLTSIEQRLESIETRLNSFPLKFAVEENSLAQVSEIPHAQAISNNLANLSIQSVQNPKTNSVAPTLTKSPIMVAQQPPTSVAERLPIQPVEKPSFFTNVTSTVPASIAPIVPVSVAPIVSAVVTPTTSDMFQSTFTTTMKPPASAVADSSGLSTSKTTIQSTSSQPVSEKQTIVPTNNSSGLFSTLGSQNEQSAPLFQPFTFGQTAPLNLFENSIRKFNIADTFGSSADKKEDNKGDSDDEGPVQTEELPIENTCDMKTIEIRSGEEDEDTLFKERCKLFRFRDKEYKERGLGDIKVQKNRETGKIRLIMRRELINLVCLNCWSSSNVDRVRETQIRFAGIDASDGEPEMNVFLAKFKTSDMTDRFESYLIELSKQLDV